MTSQPNSRSAEDNAPACFFARETSTRQPASGRLFVIAMAVAAPLRPLHRRAPGSAVAPRRSNASPTCSPSATGSLPLCCSRRTSEPSGRATIAVNRSIAIAHFGKRADGDLASAAQLVQQRSLAGRRRPRCRVVEERQVLAHGNVALANLDAERALSGRGTHETLRQHFPHPLRFAQPGQAGRGQDDGVVLAFLQLAHARVHIAAQRMNHQVGPHSLQLRLPPQAAGAHPRALAAAL